GERGEGGEAARESDSSSVDFDVVRRRGESERGSSVPDTVRRAIAALPRELEGEEEVPDVWISREFSERDPVKERLVEQALKTSPLIDAARARVRAAAASVREARSSYLPTIGVSERYTTTDDPTAAFSSVLEQGRFTNATMANINSPSRVDDWATSLYLRALIFDFGRRAANIRAAKEMKRRMELMDAATARDVRYNVTAAYDDLLSARATVALWKKTVELIERHRDLVKAYYDAGVVLYSDLLSVEVKLAAVREELVSARNAVEVAYSRLAAAVGISKEALEIEEKALARPIYRGTEEEAVAAAREANPVIVSLGAAVEAARNKAAAAGKGNLPTISAEVRRDWHGADEKIGLDRRSVTAAVVVDVPFFDGWRTKARREAAEARVEEAAAVRRQALLDLELAARTAHNGVREALKRIEIADSSVEAARAALRIIEERYRSGMAKIVDLIEAERGLTEARVNAVRARAAAWKALAAVERVAGRKVVLGAGRKRGAFEVEGTRGGGYER
ncbi:MAG: TolC family protein, partial [Candidatus Hydrogenedentota bacterium]